MTGEKHRKFNVIIGNPPYQEENVGNNHQYKPIYNLFMDSAYKVGHIVELITPARFLSLSGATPKKWDRKILNSKKIKIKYFNADSSQVFDNVDIKGGVVVTYYQDDADFKPIKIFIPQEQLQDIYQKVSTKSDHFVSEHVYSPDSFRFTDKMLEDNDDLKGRTDASHEKSVSSSVFSRYPEIFKAESFNNSVGVIGRKDNERIELYTRTEYLRDPGDLNSYKLLIAGASGKGDYGEPLAKPIIAKPMEAHTQTFLAIGSLNSESEAQALLNYIKTKFFRALLGIMKTTQNNQAKRTWSLIPWQDFTGNSDIDWTKSIPEIDQQLYDKYGLSDDEIAFIEKNVKEMK